MIAGSHTHHGKALEDGVVGAILEANSRLAPARMAAGSRVVEGFNRNRHTKLEPKPRETTLGLLCIDSADGKPLAVLFNFTAHPATLPAQDLRFSADWVGAARNTCASRPARR